MLLDATIPHPAYTHRVSIRLWNRSTLQYHSSSPLSIPSNLYTPKMLLKTLASWDNAPLWTTLQIKGDNCGWIFCGLMRGSLTIRYDGSYMPMVANNVCSCAVVIYCSHDKKYAEVTWVEKSSKQLADIYQTKILGGCCAQLLVKATITGRNVQGLGTPKYRCNNMGVVYHGTHHHQPLLEKQAQSDVLRYFKIWSPHRK
jgi:hypothetical protein